MAPSRTFTRSLTVFRNSVPRIGMFDSVCKISDYLKSLADSLDCRAVMGGVRCAVSGLEYRDAQVQIGVKEINEQFLLERDPRSAIF